MPVDNPSLSFELRRSFLHLIVLVRIMLLNRKAQKNKDDQRPVEM